LSVVQNKDQRLNLRISEQANRELRRAATLNQQDLTSFILGAALEKARSIFTSELAVTLSPQEFQTLERILRTDTAPTSDLIDLMNQNEK
jgi:uncharacterized protein (DUF1778 family)